MDDELIKSIKVLALKAVEHPTFDDTMRHLARWYSETYHYPLPEAYKLPDEELLRTWFEVKYRGLRESHDEKELEEYDQTKDALLYEHEVETTELEDEDWAKEMIETIKKEQAATLNKLKTATAAVVKSVDQSAQAKAPNLINDIPDHMEISGGDFETPPGDD